MKQNTMLMIGGAVVVYILWKKSQEEKTSEIDLIGEMPEESMSRASGRPPKICYHRKEDGTIIRVPCPWDRGRF